MDNLVTRWIFVCQLCNGVIRVSDDENIKRPFTLEKIRCDCSDPNPVTICKDCGGTVTKVSPEISENKPKQDTEIVSHSV